MRVGPVQKYLEVVTSQGRNKGEEIPLFEGRDREVLGRAKPPDTTIRLYSERTSRVHASLDNQPNTDDAAVNDLSSLNGTRVNGIAVTSDNPIHDRDTLQIGPEELFIFRARTLAGDDDSKTLQLPAEEVSAIIIEEPPAEAK